jgi:hypothetical protein
VLVGLVSYKIELVVLHNRCHGDRDGGKRP